MSQTERKKCGGKLKENLMHVLIENGGSGAYF
jgi:predicted nucleic acid-binding Zn ribbon protein